MNWDEERKKKRIERPASTKAFALETRILDQRTVMGDLQKDKDFADIQKVHGLCIAGMTAAFMNIYKNVQENKPDLLKGLSKDELLAYYVNNKCMPTAKIYSGRFRKAYVRLLEEKTLKKNIVKYANGGDAFHPYL